MKKIFKIEGMHCESCAKIIQMELEEKVNKILVDYKRGFAEVDYDHKKINDRQIAEMMIKLGYKVRK